MTRLVATASRLTVGFDIGDRTTHCGALRDRDVVARGGTKTTREGLDRALGDDVGSRVVLEAGSQSP